MKNTGKFLFLSLALALCLFMVPAFSFSQSEEEPSLKEQKTKEGFLIDLKSLVTRSKKKIEEANDLIEEQDKFERNKQREDKAREYYEKGMQLYDNGKFDKAVEYWERAVKITEHPEMSGYLGDSIKRTKKEQKALTEAEKRRLERLEKERGYTAKEVEKVYAKGVSYFKRQKYINARQQFEEVDKMFPDHKATRSYLMLISQKISSEQQELIGQKLEEESEAYVEGKENWKSDLEKKAKIRRQKLEEQADVIYNDAVELYKTKQYLLAKERFKEVEWVLPNYKSTIKYLKKLDRTIKVDEVLSAEDKQRLFEKQMRQERLAGESSGEFEQLHSEDKAKEVQKSLEEQAEFVYLSAVSLYKKNNLVESKEMFMETEKILPDYKKTRKYLASIEKKIPEYQRDLLDAKKEQIIESKETEGETIKQDVIERREKYAKEAETKYNEAMAFYKAMNYVEAKLKLIQVEALYPDYLDTRDYLATIDAKISEQVSQGDEKAIRGLQVAWRDEETPPAIPRPAGDDLTTDDVHKLYKRGIELYKKDQWDDARTVFMQVQEAQPGYKGVDKYLDNIYEKIAKLDRSQRKQRDVRSEGVKLVSNGTFKEEAGVKYKEALLLFKEKRHVEARKKFVEVNELVPGYKSTEKYIKRLNKLVPSIYYDEKETSTVKKQEDQQAEQLSEAPPALREQAEVLYQEAISHYKSREFTNARRSFTKVEGLVPDYKMTSVYLSRIAKLLGPEAALLGSDLGEADKQYVDNEHERQLDKQREKTADTKSQKTLVKSYSEKKAELKKDEQEYEKQQRIVEQLKKEERREDIDMYADKVDVLYAEALKLYKEKDYDLAMRKFRAIDMLYPDYRSARHYMTQIDRIKIINEEKLRLAKEIEATKIAADEARKAADELKNEQKLAERTRKDRAASDAQKKKIDKAALTEKAEAAPSESPAAAVSTQKVVEVPVSDEKQQPVIAKSAAATVADDEVDLEKDILVQRMAQEWKAAEEKADSLTHELREKELALRWRLNQEERIAQLMAQEAELERLDDLKYSDFRKDIDQSHEDEEKALDASRKRVEDRISELKNEYKAKKVLQAQAADIANEEWEQEYDVLKEERDRLASIKVAVSTDVEPDVSTQGKTKIRKETDLAASAQLSSSDEIEIPQVTAFTDGIDAAQINKDLLGELAALEKTIKEEESTLVRDRQLAQERLQREAARRSELASKRKYERVEQAPVKEKPTLSFEERYQQLSEEENEAGLERLIKARQRELRDERERIRQQFEESLDELYSKAVDLYHAGMVNDAERMFQEVKTMAPGYKKTEGYLQSINSSMRKGPQPEMSSNELGQTIVHPTQRELNTRDSMISGALDSLEGTY